MPPLDGVRVIDLTRVVAGPYCTMMLGDMGAEVLKIEEPEHGDDSRAWAPFIHGSGSFFLSLNRSKKSVGLDLKSPDGADALGCERWKDVSTEGKVVKAMRDFIIRQSANQETVR